MKKINLLALILLVVISLYSIFPLLKNNYFLTDDGAILLIRFADAFRSFKDGQFPLVWAGYLNHGYGYPIFIFLYPLYLYLGIILKALGFGLITAFKAIFILAMLFSAISMYVFLKEIYSKSASFLSSLVYLYAPYHLANVYKRGSVGEILVLALAPLVFWSFVKIIKNKSKKNISRGKKEILIGSVAFSLIILAHNSLALLFATTYAFFIMFYFLIFNESLRAKFKVLLKLVLIMVLGFGLSCFFWLPALIERQFTRQPLIKIANFTNFFITSEFVKNDLFNQQNIFLGIGITNLILIIASLAAFIFFNLKHKKTKKTKNIKNLYYLLFFTLFLLGFFMSTPASSFLWQNSYLTNLIQFPFRFLNIIIISASVLIAYFLDKFRHKKSILALLFIFIVIGILVPTKSIYKNIKYESLTDEFYVTNDSTTDVKQEYMPIWVKNEISEYPDRFVYIKDALEAKNKDSSEPENKIFNIVKKSDSITFDITLNQKAKIVFNQVYFPGWQLKVDNSLRKIDYETSGLIEFGLDEGKHNLEIRLRDTPIRRFSKIISFVSLIILILYIFSTYIPKLRSFYK